MTEQNTARTPAALAEHLGLTVPQLAQHLARLTQTEGLSAQGLALSGEHLSAAEVLGVLATCPGTAEGEPAPLLDYPAPLNRSNMTAALCHGLGGAFAALGTWGPLSAERGERVRLALAQAAAAAQVLAQLDATPAPLSAAQVMTAQAERAGGELYPAHTLAQFRAEGERRAAEHRHPVTGQPLAGGEC